MTMPSPLGLEAGGGIPRLPSSPTSYGIWRQQQTVVAGPGSLTALAEQIERAGAERVFLLTTGSLVRERRLLDGVREQLGARGVGEFGECRAHTPRTVVLAAAAQVRDAAPDLLVSFGGSTVTDTAKALSFALANDLRTPDAFDDPDLGRDPDRPRPGSGPVLPKVAIPTTLSGAEYSAYAGITDEATQTKRIYTQPGLAPIAVLLDQDVTGATPRELWCATGVKCLSDSIELLCSPASHPFVQILTRSGVELFYRNLPASFAEDPALRAHARGACQHATWMSAFSLANSTSKLGIGMAVRHQLGAMGVGHGEATCIMLPHILAFNWPALGTVRADVAQALDLTGADEQAVAQRLEQFVGSLGLPTRLSEVGVREEHIPGLATRMLADPGAIANVRDVTADDFQALLRAAL